MAFAPPFPHLHIRSAHRGHFRTHAPQLREAYSITLSARATKPGGISTPSSLAALRLMTRRPEAPSVRLNVVGVGHQRSGLDRVAKPANGGKAIFLRQPTQQNTVRVVLSICANRDCVYMIPLHGIKRSAVLSLVDWTLQLLIPQGGNLQLLSNGLIDDFHSWSFPSSHTKPQFAHTGIG
jgi:hypothetical protein